MLIAEQYVMLKNNSILLRLVRILYGVTILETGEACMVLNPRELSRSMKKSMPVSIATREENMQKKRILLVEDSITVRLQEKRVLERCGYEVIIAVDGVDAQKKMLANHSFDAVLSDIEMPNMNGLDLVKWIRRTDSFADIPVIIITTLGSDEHKKQGMEAGANAYIPKESFSQKLLLETLDRLL